MGYLVKTIRKNVNPTSFIVRQCLRTFRSSTSYNTEKNVPEQKQSDDFDISAEFREPEMTEEEIIQKRFKSRLPERIYKEFVLKQFLPIETKYDFEMYRLRHLYARHGANSELNPGICWPSKQEMLDIIERDKTLLPSLHDTIKNAREARLEAEERKKAYEEEVDKNMEKHEKWLAEYYAKIEKKKKEALEMKQKREKLIEEVSEYLGYEIDPRDPRFQEAVEQKEKERKKVVKAKKQQESYDKMIAKLKKMAEQNA